MPLNIDDDRRGIMACRTGVFGHSEPEGDQQDVLDAGMERSGHLAEQHARRLGIQ